MLHLVVCADFQRLGGLRGINQSSAANRQAKEIETVVWSGRRSRALKHIKKG